MNVLRRKLNSAYYRFRANRWRWHPHFLNDDKSIVIDRPIFLLGTQGGGLTLTNRILRRHPQVVSIAGDCRHWAGPDEMHMIMEGALPEPLKWPEVSLRELEPGPSSWVYACDELLPHYRQDGSGASAAMQDEFRSVLRRVIRLSGGPDGESRFLDMSQTNTVRVGWLQDALRDCDPRFVLITRDPFAMCWRAVHGVEDVAALNRSDEEKFEIAVQHWKNSMTEALACEGQTQLAQWRFEDLLAEPERILTEICEFTGLPMRPELVPNAADRIPFGSAFDAIDRSKWYPLRTNVNDRYLKQIPDWAVQVLFERCGPLIERLGYQKP